MDRGRRADPVDNVHMAEFMRNYKFTKHRDRIEAAKSIVDHSTPKVIVN